MTPRPDTPGPGADPSGPAQPSTPESAGPAAALIERFGGIRPMANKLNTPVTTVQGWKKRGAIPPARRADLRAAAKRHGITLDEAELEAATPMVEPAAAEMPVTPPEPVSADPVSTAAPVSAADPVPGADPVGADPVGADPVPADRAGAAADQPIPDVAATETEEARSMPPVIEPPAEPRRSGSGLATAASVLALVVSLAALGTGFLNQGAPAANTADSAGVQALSDRVARLEQRPAPAAPDLGTLETRIAQLEQRPAPAAPDLGALETRIAQLEQRPAPEAPAPAEDPRVGELTQQVAALRQTIGTLEQRLTAAGQASTETRRIGEDVASLRQQISGVQQTVQSQRSASTQAEALVLASGQLRSALSTGQPFEQELKAVRAIGVSDPEVTQSLDVVAPFAPRGVPTLPTLVGRFETQAGDIVRAERRGPGGSWTSQVLGTLSTLVTVRQQGAGVVGTGAEAVVARAEAALKEDNLALAVKEVSTLKGPAADAAAGWLADAKARLATAEASQRLGTRAIALLAGAPAGAPAGGTAP